MSRPRRDPCHARPSDPPCCSPVVSRCAPRRPGSRPQSSTSRRSTPTHRVVAVLGDRRRRHLASRSTSSRAAPTSTSWRRPIRAAGAAWTPPGDRLIEQRSVCVDGARRRAVAASSRTTATSAPASGSQTGAALYASREAALCGPPRRLDALDSRRLRHHVARVRPRRPSACRPCRIRRRCSDDMRSGDQGTWVHGRSPAAFDPRGPAPSAHDRFARRALDQPPPRTSPCRSRHRSGAGRVGDRNAGATTAAQYHGDVAGARS